MRVAYLIVAHNHPERLRRLVEAIEAPWADIFIHIDKREPLAPYQECLKGKDVRFVENRIKGNWAGWSLVTIHLRLLQTAYSPDYKYYKLLSNSCYPVKNQSFIYNFFAKHNENFVCYWSISEKDRITKEKASTVKYYHFIDAINIENFLRPERFRSHPIKYFLLHPIQISYWSLFYLLVHPPKRHLIKKLIPVRKPPPGLEIHIADDWWCLRGPFVAYLLNFINENPDTIRFFKYIKTPSEYLIPSLLAGSKMPYNRTLIHANMMSNPLNANKILELLNNPEMLFIRKVNDDSFALLKNINK